MNIIIIFIININIISKLFKRYREDNIYIN